MKRTMRQAQSIRKYIFILLERNWPMNYKGNLFATKFLSGAYISSKFLIFHNSPEHRILTCDAFLLFKAHLSRREWILMYVKIYKEAQNVTPVLTSVATSQGWRRLGGCAPFRQVRSFCISCPHSASCFRCMFSSVTPKTVLKGEVEVPESNLSFCE